MCCFQFVISVLGSSADPKLQSAATQIVRGVSSGSQTFETDPTLYPVNKPIPKLEGKVQCTGEAKYINDIPTVPGELHAAFVVAEVGNCNLGTIDPSAALVCNFCLHNRRQRLYFTLRRQCQELFLI